MSATGEMRASRALHLLEKHSSKPVHPFEGRTDGVMLAPSPEACTDALPVTPASSLNGERGFGALVAETERSPSSRRFGEEAVR